MSSIDARLRDGLSATALRVGAAADMKRSVLARGKRKRALRRAIGSGALASVVALAVLAIPRLGSFTPAPVPPAAAGRPYTNTAAGKPFTTVVPPGWEVAIDYPGATVLRSETEPEGLAVISPSAVTDAAAEFGVASPGPLTLNSWAGGLPLESDGQTTETNLGSERATLLIGTLNSRSDLLLLDLAGDRDLELPAQATVALYILEDDPVLIVAWAESQARLGDGPVSGAVEHLIFER